MDVSYINFLIYIIYFLISIIRSILVQCNTMWLYRSWTRTPLDNDNERRHVIQANYWWIFYLGFLKWSLAQHPTIQNGYDLIQSKKIQNPQIFSDLRLRHITHYGLRYNYGVTTFTVYSLRHNYGVTAFTVYGFKLRRQIILRYMP